MKISVRGLQPLAIARVSRSSGRNRKRLLILIMHGTQARVAMKTGLTKFTNSEGYHECVFFPQQGSSSGHTSNGKAGGVPTKNTPEGTWIATFVNGKFKGHVGSFVSMDSKGNISMVDQHNKSGPKRNGAVQEYTYTNKPDSPNNYISNDASNYRIVLW